MRGSVLLYEHAGSGNHGCEAIAHAMLRLPGLSKGKDYGKAPVLLSSRASEDLRYTLGKMRDDGAVRIAPERHLNENKAAHVLYYAWRKVSGDKLSYLRYRFREVLPLLKEKPLAVAIGGDNYCYPELVPDLMLAHELMLSAGLRTVLYGCSIEPDSLKGNNALLQDLMSYDRIVAREHITYDALLDAGLTEGKVRYAPDPAFTLPTADDAKLPEGFLPGKMVGLNLSPMAAALEGRAGAAKESFTALIAHILESTDMSVALIPHVVKAGGDDRLILKELKEAFLNDPRVILTDDADCTVLKARIAKCGLFVGARTHATIAAYSSCVPTLVLGYSVKSRGIAADIFGSENENFVLPVQSLTEPSELTGYFDRLYEKREEVSALLKERMPAMRDEALAAAGVFTEEDDG